MTNRRKENMFAAVRLFAVVVMLFSAVPCLAQRTMSGRVFIDLQGMYRPGVEVGVGMYEGLGYWKASLEGVRHSRDFKMDDMGKLRYLHLFAQGEYMFRLFATYSRSVNIYAGAGALVGMELVDPWKQVPETVVWEHEKMKFLYGASAKAEAEFYVSDRLSLYVLCQPLLTLGSQYTIFCCPCGGGLRFSL